MPRLKRPKAWITEEVNAEHVDAVKAVIAEAAQILRCDDNANLKLCVCGLQPEHWVVAEREAGRAGFDVVGEWLELEIGEMLEGKGGR